MLLDTNAPPPPLPPEPQGRVPGGSTLRVPPPEVATAPRACSVSLPGTRTPRTPHTPPPPPHTPHPPHTGNPSKSPSSSSMGQWDALDRLVSALCKVQKLTCLTSERAPYCVVTCKHVMLTKIGLQGKVEQSDQCTEKSISGTTERCCICIPGRACVERFVTCLRPTQAQAHRHGYGGSGDCH